MQTIFTKGSKLLRVSLSTYTTNIYTKSIVLFVRKLCHLHKKARAGNSLDLECSLNSQTLKGRITFMSRKKRLMAFLKRVDSNYEITPCGPAPPSTEKPAMAYISVSV